MAQEHSSNHHQLKLQPPIPPPQRCPRCDSSETKFCYYNNHSQLQPRYFCKTCRRYWTQGGTLRNIPVGGSCRKERRSKRSSTTSTSTDPNNLLYSPPQIQQESSYVGSLARTLAHINNNANIDPPLLTTSNSSSTTTTTTGASLAPIYGYQGGLGSLNMSTSYEALFSPPYRQSLVNNQPNNVSSSLSLSSGSVAVPLVVPPRYMQCDQEQLYNHQYQFWQGVHGSNSRDNNNDPVQGTMASAADQLDSSHQANAGSTGSTPNNGGGYMNFIYDLPSSGAPPTSPTF
ncbi:hypothetical protein Scep_028306 [Stephania cephalantha]|uniref:Dof zinc finger protein n=1 Tax=Stephania cephalantha TaxID=152367 RepID=A0AAP0E9Q0_9MAGN